MLILYFTYETKIYFKADCRRKTCTKLAVVTGVTVTEALMK